MLGGRGGLRVRDAGALGTWLGLAVVALIVAIPLRGLYRFTGGTMEEGFMLYFPERIAHGDVPNVDFLHLYGPGSLQVLTGWYGIFGHNLAAERTFGLLQHIGILLALFALARAWGRLAQYRGVLESLNLATLMKQELDLMLEQDPNHDGALHALALWHVNVPWVFGGRSDQTRGLFDQAIAAQPTVLHHLEYGEALITLGDPAAARAQFEAALRLSAPTAADRFEQARAQELLGTL